VPSAQFHKDRKKKPTPSNIKRSSTRKTLRNHNNNIRLQHILERRQETLQHSRAHTKEHEHVDNQEFVVAGHDEVVKSGKRVDRMCFFGDEEEDEGDEKCQERYEECGDEGLEHFALPFVVVQVTFLFGTPSVRVKE